VLQLRYHGKLSVQPTVLSVQWKLSPPNSSDQKASRLKCDCQQSTERVSSSHSSNGQLLALGRTLHRYTEVDKIELLCLLKSYLGKC